MCLRGMDAVIHTATLHKPHVATHARQDFVDTNITGTLSLLEEARDAQIGTFVFTSTTSVFGRALTPSRGEPAAWITEDIVPALSLHSGGCVRTKLYFALNRLLVQASPFVDPDDRPKASPYCVVKSN